MLLLGRLVSRAGIATFLILVAWLAFVLSSGLTDQPPRLPWLPHRAGLGLGHLLGYFVLAALFHLVLLGFIRDRSPARRLGIGLLAIALAWSVGLAVEVGQELVPNRGAQVTDLLLNGVGASAGAVIVLLLRQIRISTGRITAAAAAVVVMLLITVGVSAVVWDPSLPRVGDHWHARYQVSICGTELEPLPGAPGGVHTHGAGVIHIHPATDDQAGRRATLALFLKSTGGNLTDGSLYLPSGQRYENGDRCPDGEAGLLSVHVNGNAVTKPSSYVPRDEDEILIVFGAER